MELVFASVAMVIAWQTITDKLAPLIDDP